jgi:hypothetical protein
MSNTHVSLVCPYDGCRHQCSKPLSWVRTHTDIECFVCGKRYGFDREKIISEVEMSGGQVGMRFKGVGLH